MASTALSCELTCLTAGVLRQGGQASAGPPQSGEAPAEQSQQALLESLIGKLQG